MQNKLKLGMKERYVSFKNTSDRPVRVSDSMLPNGGIEVAPGGVGNMPADIWGRKFRTPGIRRATESEIAESQALAISPTPAVEPELEDTRIDRLREIAEELGVSVKGNKAAIVQAVRIGLLTKSMADHAAHVVETVAQGAYEHCRAEQIKAGEAVPSWSDADDDTKAGAIAQASEIVSDPNKADPFDPFGHAARQIYVAAKGEPISDETTD